MVILHCYVSVWMYYQGRHLIIITTTTITTSLVSVCSPTCLWSFAGIIFIFQIMDMVAIFLGGLQVEDISNVVVVTTPCRKDWLDLTLLSHCNCIDPDYPHEHSMPISVPPGKEYRHQASYFFCSNGGSANPHGDFTPKSTVSPWLGWFWTAWQNLISIRVSCSPWNN